MVRGKVVNRRFGIGEWYGHHIESIAADEKVRYAKITKTKKEPCPFRPAGAMCNKKGGVCSFALYCMDKTGRVFLDPDYPDLVTLCPMRFWENNRVFKAIGHEILDRGSPILVKEIGFLRSIPGIGGKSRDRVGRIDMVLANLSETGDLRDWCAIELQAVYFSGGGMKSEFEAISENPDGLSFPTTIRRPDFRSSGPKRLMPQLQIKVPTLRRWGIRMAIVVDRPFFASIASMRKVPHLSNADIAWFVISYGKDSRKLKVDRIVLTTLEDSVEGLTAGTPVTKKEFESELTHYLKKKNKVIELW